MTSMIVVYDLRAPGRNYQGLYDELESFGIKSKITESAWFIKTNLTCAEVRNSLIAQLDKNDRIFVGKLSGAAAWHNTICSNNFLLENL